MITLLLLGCHRSFAFDSSPTNKWHNSLKPEGKIGAELTLVKKGSSDYAIVISTGVTQPEAKAAEQLQYWLQEMTTARLPILTEDAISAENTKIISVGRTELLKTSVPEMASRKLEKFRQRQHRIKNR